MGMTLTEKILARAAGKDEVKPGQLIMARPRAVCTQDLSGKQVFQAFDKLGLDKMPNPDLCVVIWDHRCPTEDVKSENMHQLLRNYIKQYHIKNVYDVGRGGIMHQIMAEKCYSFPGYLTVATESHTPTGGGVGGVVVGVGTTEAACALATGDVWLRVPESIKVILTGELPPYVMGKDVAMKMMSLIGYEKDAVYKAVEFAGDGVKNLSMDARLSICNFVADVGAKNAIMPIDQVTVDYFKNRTCEPVEMIAADEDAVYDRVITINMSELEPLVSVPPNMDNIKTIGEIEPEKIKVDFACVSTCTNGRYEDIEAAASILKGRKLHPDVHFICAPASNEVFIKAIENGCVAAMVEAGVEFAPVSCGPCGGHHGVLGDNQVAIAASPRNWTGRMGSKLGKIYLSNPYVVAASAVKGYICDPRNL